MSHTYSIKLPPTTVHEDIFWPDRQMVFIQRSLSGTAILYIRLNDTYKQDWSGFFTKQAFKNPFSSQKNAYYAQVLTLVKKIYETVQHVALKVQQLVEKD